MADTVVKLSITCSDLANKDGGGLSDPICAVFLSDQEVGRTEFIMNTLNPSFKKNVLLSLNPADEQPLVFKLYDVDFLSGQEAVLSEDNLIGSFATTFKAIIADDDNMIYGDLSKSGSIVIQAKYAAGKPPAPAPPAPPPAPHPHRHCVKTNVLISKGLPDSYLDACRASLGDQVADLAVQIYERRRMLDCYKVPAAPAAEEWEESWDGYRPSRDPKGEALVRSLIEAVRATGKKFVDPHFPADNTSLFADPGSAGANAEAEQTFRKDQDPFLAGVKGIEWKRSFLIGNPAAQPVVFSGSISPDDVAQGRLGNCYFLAAIASCAQGADDILLKDLIIEEGIDLGIFGVKFFINGRWTTVVVDDQFPCTQSRGRWNPIFASPRVNPDDPQNEKELWSLIFEKAWAKLHLSYEATAGGFTDDTHNYLTAGVCSAVELGSNTEQEWATIKGFNEAHDSAFLSTAVRDGMDQDGLIGGHAYSVLSVRETSAGRMVQVRNPWGSSEWTGAYGRSSNKWTAALKAELGETLAEDGSFWMTWPDFYKHFSSVDVCDPRSLCKMYSDNIGRVDGVSSQWVAGISAGGRPAHPTFKYNPAFELTAQGPEVIIGFYQPDTRYIETVKPTTWMDMYLYVYSVGAQPKEVAKLEYKRQTSVRLPVTPGAAYRVVATAWGPGVQGAFVITACGFDATLRALPQETPTPDAAGKMALQPSRQSLCCYSNKEIDGSYYSVPEGKLRPEYLQAYRSRPRA